MRGVAFRCESLSSHFVCPSCSRRIAKDSSFNGSSQPFRSGGTLSRRKAFSTQTRVSVSKERLTRSKWAPPRSLPSQTRSLAQSVVREPSVTSGDIEGVLSTSGEPTSRDRGRSENSPTESRHDAVMRTIAEMQPDCVMEAFLDPQNYDIIFKSLPAATFAEAFRLLSPRYFTDDYVKLHRYLHPEIAEARSYKSLRQICDEFFGNITTIADMRRRAGHSLGLYEYTHLLDCARAMGHGHMAYGVWKDMLQERVKPNLECYNYYMEARVWDNAYYSNERFNLRVTPFVQRKRSRLFRNPNFQGYKTGPGGVKDKVSDLFAFMTEQGIQGDEHTFVNTMVASSRVGHMSGVKDILKAVWDIDVDLLTSAKDERSLPEVRSYAPTSPLHPTERLLYAVAHIFGTNHDFPSGLQTVDFISRKYNIPIPEHVWLEFLEWAFVLSVKRHGPGAYEKNPGKIPPDAVISVFNTITSEPYNIEPTTPMYHLMVKVSWSRRDLQETLKYMRAGLSLLKKTIAARNIKAFDLSLLHRPFQEAQEQQHTQKIFNPFLKKYYTLCHEFTLTQIKATRDAALIERWSRLLIAGNRHWTPHRNAVSALDWQRQTISDMLEEWQLFFPKSTYYQTSNGTVTFLPHQLSRHKTWRPPEMIGDVAIREKGEMVRSMEAVNGLLRRAQTRQAEFAEIRRMDAESGDGEVVSSPQKEGG